MIDLRYALVILANRMPWTPIEAALAPALSRPPRPGREVEVEALCGTAVQAVGGGVSPAGRERLPIRLMAARLSLKHAFDLSDEEVVARWSENVVWPSFSGLECYEPRLPCDATQVGRFRRAIGEAGVAGLLKATIDTAVTTKAVQAAEFERVIKRQRTILGIVLRAIQRKRAPATTDLPTTLTRLDTLIERAERIRTQPPKDKHKLYARHAPEVACIGTGKARKPYEFGVKVSVAVTHRSGLIVGARSFPGNPYDGHMLSAQLKQTPILLDRWDARPKEVVVDLGVRGVDHDNPDVQIIHRGKYQSLSRKQRRWLKRRQAVEPAIGHLKNDHRRERCWLQGTLGDALPAVLCAAGDHRRWLLRAIAKRGLKGLFWRPMLEMLLRLVRPTDSTPAGFPVIPTLQVAVF